MVNRQNLDQTEIVPQLFKKEGQQETWARTVKHCNHNLWSSQNSQILENKFKQACSVRVVHAVGWMTKAKEGKDSIAFY